MAYTSLLRFGTKVHIEMMRDEQRRLCRLRTLLDDQEEGYLLETDGEKQEGALFVLPSHQLHESFQAGIVSSEHQRETTAHLDYEEWVHSCIQQATAWARSHAIQSANDSILQGLYAEARETYHDVIDHFPPPPDGPLLQWNYYRCIAEMEGIEAAKEGLLLWLEDALPIAGINVNSVILEPAKKILGLDAAIEVAKNWLLSSSPHDPAHKMTKRWLDKQGQDGMVSLTWKFGSINPLQTRKPLLIPLLNGDVMAIGGEDEAGELSQKAAIWHAKTHKWTSITDIPCGLSNHMGISLDESSVMVAGGRSAQDEYSKRVFRWSYTEDSWIEEQNLAIGRRDAQMLSDSGGQIVVFGGEDLLSSDTSMEVWDRRNRTWSLIGHSGLYLSDICVTSMRSYILVTGASVITSGFGAMYWSPNLEQWTYPEELRGIGLDGISPLSDNEAIVWSKKNGGVDIGVWSLTSKSVKWHCKDVDVIARSDLTCVLEYDEEQCIVLSTSSDMMVQSRSINPMTGNSSELPELKHQNILIEDISSCSILSGIFLLYPNGYAIL